MTFYSFNADYVQRLKDGDPEVEGHFALYFGDLLELKLRSQVHSAEELQDIRQETLKRVLIILRTSGIEHPERLGAMVLGVCRNIQMEGWRSKARYEPISDQQEEPRDPAADGDAPLLRAELQAAVRKALSQMREKDRIILTDVFLKEMETDEICQMYHVDPDYLRVLVHRAKKRFRKIYEAQEGKRSANA